MGYAHDLLLNKASFLAKRLGISLDKNANTCLFVSEEGLALKIPTFSLLFADFTFSTWKDRKSQGKQQGLVKACRPGKGLKIIDATAGWGKDAAILASFGAEVLMLERHPVMAALLSDALERRTISDNQVMQLFLKETEAAAYLQALVIEEYPDLIYLDPMHPTRNKSALVKKEMQVLQQMIGEDTDVLELIKLAITRVKQRVVVKWPQKIKPLLPPTFSVEGKTVRFDIYLPLRA